MIRNDPLEHTVEFTSRPLKMHLTTTDNVHLFVKEVTPISEAAAAGVVPGSMVVALNGKNIQDLKPQQIVQKVTSASLPLRITFRKPQGSAAPIHSAMGGVQGPPSNSQCVLSIDLSMMQFVICSHGILSAQCV